MSHTSGNILSETMVINMIFYSQCTQEVVKDLKEQKFSS